MDESSLPADVSQLSLGQSYDSEPPPAPELDSQGIIAEDITTKFADAVKTLAPGELIKDGFFTLFESVAALEIMDPKMDSGCVEPGEEFEETYDVSQPLLPEEVLGIIDQLLCHEMAWHLGYPLSQTILTSVYVEAMLMPSPKDIQEADFGRSSANVSSQSPMIQILRAYCLGMLKTCSFVNDRIRAEHFYEEEDFVTNTYHRDLLTQIPMAAIREALVDAEHLLTTLKDSSIPVDVIDALHQRLELRRVCLDVVECPQHRKQPDLAKKPWMEALIVVGRQKAGHELSKAKDEAFSAKLQRKLASTMPPRPIVQLSYDDAVEHLTRLFQDGLEMIDLLGFHDAQSLLNFVATFQAKKPQPLVYVRTLLQTFLFTDMEFLGTMSIRQVLDDDLSIITLAASPLLDRQNDEIEAVHDARFAMAQQMEIFRQRAAQPWLDIVRTFCQNRCRVRRTLCHILREWENLQLDAEEIDQIIQVKTRERPLHLGSDAAAETYALPLSSWTYFYKLRQMEWIVQFGFELEVYQPDELVGMYWYLNYLAKCRVQHVQRMQSFLMQRVEEVKAGPRPRDSRAVEKQLQRSLDFLRLSVLDAATTWELSDALACLYTVILRCGLFKVPPRPYGSDRMRYDLRMKPFACVGLPDLPSFDDFTAGVQQPDTPSDKFLAYAERALASAKKGLEGLGKLPPEASFSVGCHERWVAQVRNGLKACIATGIAISTLQKTLKAHQGQEEDVALHLRADVPTPADSYHEWWIVPKLVPMARQTEGKKLR